MSKSWNKEKRLEGTKLTGSRNRAKTSLLARKEYEGRALGIVVLGGYCIARKERRRDGTAKTRKKEEEGVARKTVRPVVSEEENSKASGCMKKRNKIGNSRSKNEKKVQRRCEDETQWDDGSSERVRKVRSWDKIKAGCVSSGQ